MGSVSRLANVSTHKEAPWTPPGLVPRLDDWFLSASLATVSATTAALRTTSAAGDKHLSYFPECLWSGRRCNPGNVFAGLDLCQRQGLEELISVAPSSFDHGVLFSTLQRCTLQHRMSDSFSCLVGPCWSALHLHQPSITRWSWTHNHC